MSTTVYTIFSIPSFSYISIQVAITGANAVSFWVIKYLRVNKLENIHRNAQSTFVYMREKVFRGNSTINTLCTDKAVTKLILADILGTNHSAAPRDSRLPITAQHHVTHVDHSQVHATFCGVKIIDSDNNDSAIIAIS